MDLLNWDNNMSKIKVQLRMNSKVKKLWLTALRSGKFLQGQSALIGTDYEEGKEVKKYCCLGVLCKLYAKEKRVNVNKLSQRGDGEFPVDKVMHWAGLPTGVIENQKVNGEVVKCNDVKVKGKNKSLANMNDNDKTFIQIAKVIEKEL